MNPSFQKPLSLVKNKIRLQRLLNAAVPAIASFALTAALIIPICTYAQKPLLPIIFIALLPPLIFVLIALLKPLPNLELAKLIDKKLSFNERLSSAIAFEQSPNPTPLMLLQIEETKKALPQLDIKAAFPLQKPQRLFLIPLSLAFLLLAWLFSPILSPSSPTVLTQKMITPPDSITLSPDDAPIIYDTTNIDQSIAEIRKNQLEQIIKNARELEDEETLEQASKLLELLQKDQQAQLSPEKFNEQIDEIQEELQNIDPNDLKEKEELDKAISQAASEFQKELNKQKITEPELKQLADALQKNDYENAAKLLESFMKNINPDDLLKNLQKYQKLSSLFKNFASNLDPTDPELKEALKKNKELIDKLKKSLSKSKKPSAKDQKSLQEAEQRQNDLENQQNNAKDQQSGLDKSLDKLKDAFNKTADKLQNPPPNDQNQKPENTPNDQNQKPENQNPNNQQTPPENKDDGNNKPQPSNNKNAEDPNDGQKPNDKGKEKLSDDAASELDKLNDEEKKQKNKDDLQSTSEKMKQDAQRSQGKKQNERKKKQVQDYLNKAKNQQQPDPKNQEKDSENKQSQKNAQSNAQKAPQTQTAKNDQGKQSATNNQQANQNEQKTLAGKGSDSPLGKETNLKDAKYQDQIIDLEPQQDENSPQETIKATSQKGFVSTQYKEVYQDYQQAVEEVLEDEKIPPGYKQYIRRYFDYIQPQQ